ncbi:MAG: hypothetical protein IJ647_01905 [Prevotella sp.]|nr:hypothetical protein [Prevotella sp.]
MEKDLRDLTKEQLIAQVKLCFKFMAQCRAILEGEDIADEAAIRLIDPTGDSNDMELFYKCKQVANDDSLSKAVKTIALQDKKISKLQKRLAKKSEELRSFDSLNLSEFLEVIPLEIERIFGLIPADEVRVQEPKYKKGDKVFFLLDGVVRTGTVCKGPFWLGHCYGYYVESMDGGCKIVEDLLFANVDELLKDLKEHINGSND